MRSFTCLFGAKKKDILSCEGPRIEVGLWGEHGSIPCRASFPKKMGKTLMPDALLGPHVLATGVHKDDERYAWTLHPPGHLRGVHEVPHPQIPKQSSIYSIYQDHPAPSRVVLNTV